MLAKLALIVDDSRTARAVLKHQLNQFDLIVESACDGNHALEILRDHIPDVIFLDHIMPGLDGFQVLQLLKDNQTTRNIPVVMYTSQAATQYTSEAKSLGAIGVIPKKVTSEQLVQVLDKAEIYRFKAVNEEHHAPAESANDETGRDVRGQALNKPACRSGLSDSHGARDARTPTVALDGNVTQAGAASGYQQHDPQRSSSSRSWFATILLALLVLAQAYGFSRDRQQHEIILDLRQQLEQLELQEQQLLQTREEVALEQRQLADATWRQVQFVVDVLVAQLKQE
jgi:CheY-like chemotaxis protein